MIRRAASIETATEVVLLLDDRRCTDMESILLSDVGISSDSLFVAMTQTYEVRHFEEVGGKDTFPLPSVVPGHEEVL